MTDLTHEEREKILDHELPGFAAVHDCGATETEGEHEDNGYFWYECIFTIADHPGKLFCFDYLYSNDGGLNHIKMEDIYEVVEHVETEIITTTSYKRVN